MKAARSSKTAEQMAFSRAIETRKPADERICNDPVAERFLGAKYKPFMLARPLRDIAERVIESLFAGHHYYVIARTRYIDDFLQSQLVQPPEQLLVLGAGFDSRAHRFADRLRGTAVFEIDHPATSATKKASIRRALGDGSPCVNYVPVDFNTEKLAGKLKQRGYQDGRRNVFLWEGVTPYLSIEGVNETLRFIRDSSAPGSALLFDYILESVVDGRCAMRGARNEFGKMSKTSEPLAFGIAEGGVQSFLSQRGFRDIVDVGSQELKSRYFGVAQERYIKPWWRIVIART